MHAIMKEVRAGDIVFDIGANMGNKSADFLEHGAKVVCVEPQPKMIEVLYSRFADNPNVTIVPKAVGEKPGIVEMMICEEAPTLSTFAEHWTKGRFAERNFDTRAKVEMTTLDRIIAAHGRPVYCKIDTEGYELSAIKGLNQAIPYISYEFTSEFFDHSMAVLEHLIRLGYREFNVSLGESDTFALENWVPFHELVVILKVAVSQNSLMWGDIYARHELR